MKRLNLKVLLISLLFAIIFTLISPQFFIKRDFWVSKFPVQELSLINLVFDNIDNKKEGTNIAKKPSQDGISVISLNSPLWVNREIRVKKNKQTSRIFFAISTKDIHYKIKLKFKYNSNLKISLPAKAFYHPIKYTRVSINGKDCTKTAAGKKSYTTFCKKGEILDIDITAKLKPVSAKLSKSISYAALIIFFLLYSVIFYYIILNFKLFINKIKDKIPSNKKYLYLFLILSIIYFTLSFYAATHINYFTTWWTFIGDSNVQLLTIVYSSTKRFHPYVFLPFYPILNIFILITRNFMLSVFGVYVLVTSFTVTLLCKISDIISPKTKITNLILCLIFGFSHCCIHFTYSFECYIFTAFYLSIICYLLIREMNSQDNSYLRIILISLLTGLSFGVTITNAVTILIMVSILLFTRNKRKKFLTFILLSAAFAFCFIGLKDSVTHGEAAKNTFFKGTKDSIERWCILEKRGFKIFKYNSLQRPISDKHKALSSVFLYYFLGFFITGLALSFSPKISSKDKKLFYTFCLALMYNFSANYVWLPSAGLLFAHNHFVLWFILAGYCNNFIYIHMDNKCKNIYQKVLTVLLLIFLAVLITYNFKNNHSIQKKALKNYPLDINLFEGSM